MVPRNIQAENSDSDVELEWLPPKTEPQSSKGHQVYFTLYSIVDTWEG